jgi:hypothetical protein
MIAPTGYIHMGTINKPIISEKNNILISIKKFISIIDLKQKKYLIVLKGPRMQLAEF